MGDDELRRLRDRAAELGRRIDLLADEARLRTPIQVGTVYTGGTLPTTPGVFYATHATDVFPGASEGAAPSTTVHTDRTVIMRVIGTPPAVGDLLVGRGIPHRWEADKRGTPPSGVTLPGCTCTNMPNPMTQTVTSSSGLLPAATFYNATLVYGPLPAWMLTIGWGGSNYLSATTYTDAGGEQFYYFLHCLLGAYVLSRVYQSSIFAGGGPYYGGNIARWFPGGGNTCSPLPFLFPNVNFLTTHGAGDAVALTP